MKLVKILTFALIIIVTIAMINAPSGTDANWLYDAFVSLY